MDWSISEDSTQLIIERAMQISQGEIQGGHPAILSCGGCFIPRPRAINPTDPLYHILNTPNENSSAKIVSALITQNVLDSVVKRENQN